MVYTVLVNSFQKKAKEKENLNVPKKEEPDDSEPPLKARKVNDGEVCTFIVKKFKVNFFNLLWTKDSHLALSQAQYYTPNQRHNCLGSNWLF